jgi:hypothetical protein
MNGLLRRIEGMSATARQVIYFALEPGVGFDLERWPSFNWNRRPISVKYAVGTGLFLWVVVGQ